MCNKKEDGNEINYVDSFVGQRIRFFRKLTGMTQTEMGKEIGITFQQVQKYEKGENRVSASKMHQICSALKIRSKDTLFPSEGGGWDIPYNLDRDVIRVAAQYSTLSLKAKKLIKLSLRTLKNPNQSESN